MPDADRTFRTCGIGLSCFWPAFGAEEESAGRANQRQLLGTKAFASEGRSSLGRAVQNVLSHPGLPSVLLSRGTQAQTERDVRER